MNARLLCMTMVVGLSLPVAAQAQMLAPGLWEVTTSNMKVDNQELPDLSLILGQLKQQMTCLLYTSPSPRDLSTSRMPSSA